MTKKQGTRKQAKATSAGSKTSKAKRKPSVKKKASKAASKASAKSSPKNKATKSAAAAKKSTARKAATPAKKAAAAKSKSKAATSRGKSSPQKATRGASSGASRSKASSKATSSTRAKAATKKKPPQKRMTAESSKTSAAKATAKKSTAKRASAKKSTTTKASAKAATAKTAVKKATAKKTAKKATAGTAKTKTTKAKTVKTPAADLLSKTVKATKAVVKLGAELDKQAKAKTTKKATAKKATAKKTTTRKAAAKKQPPKEPEVTTEELWILYRDASYKKEEEPRKLEELRNILIERHYPLVRYIAERLLQTLPKSIELDDLISAGLFGLMDAIRGFDASRGIKFKTYCSTRIRGSILDQLRSQDWVPRLVRLKAGRIEKALQKLIGEYGREPTHAELAKKLEMEHGDLVKEIQDSRAKTMFSLSEKWEDGDEDGSAEKVEILEDRKAVDPVLELNRRDLMLYITRSLTAKEKFIIERYYQDGHTMREIGELLSLTESRVCQIHSNVMGRLKNLLSPREESLVS